MKNVLIMLALFFASALVAPQARGVDKTSESSTAAASKPVAEQSIAVAKAFLAAWNRHDVAALVDAVAPDFVWFNIEGDNTARELEGAEALRSWLTRYFIEIPTVGSDAEGYVATGAFVTYRETAHWHDDKGDHRQSSIAVFEVREGKLRRGWYFPAE